MMAASLLCSLQANAAKIDGKPKDPNRFYTRTFRSGEDTLYYNILFPKQFDMKKKYPLVVVLHDEDAYATNGDHYNRKQLKTPVAALFSRNGVKDSFPAIVVFPQCEYGDPWATYKVNDGSNQASFDEKPEQTYSNELLERMIRYYLKNYPVDEKRVYIIGQGVMGGSGALDLAVRIPKKIAAVVSMGGAVSAERVKPLKKTAVKLYSSTAIKEMPITLVYDVFIGLKAAGSDKVEEVVDFQTATLPECVKSAAADPELLNWLFSKKK